MNSSDYWGPKDTIRHYQYLNDGCLPICIIQEGNGPYVSRIPILDEEDTCDCGLDIGDLIADEYVVMELELNDSMFIPDDDVLLKCPKCGKIWRSIE